MRTRRLAWPPLFVSRRKVSATCTDVPANHSGHSVCAASAKEIDSAHILAMIMHMSNLHLLFSFLLDGFFLFREGIVWANPGGARLV